MHKTGHKSLDSSRARAKGKGLCDCAQDFLRLVIDLEYLRFDSITLEVSFPLTVIFTIPQLCGNMTTQLNYGKVFIISNTLQLVWL